VNMKALDLPHPGLQSASSLAEFGVIFRRERKALGMTQSDVARKANCRRQTIADIEAGRSVTTLTFFNAILSIRKQVQLCALGLELENIRAYLGPDWED
jgi:transcriptional regulator with XRE-family HTH domain